MKSQRIEVIDYLRGLAIVAMIIIHTSYFYIANPLIYHLWNLSQFAVPVFIFCSAFIYFKQTVAKKTSFSSYLLKRSRRLLEPYYLFAIAFITLMWIKQPHLITLKYLTANIFVLGGIDINWLVLLFLQFLFVFPFISLLWHKQKHLFWIYTLVALFSSVLFLFYPIHFSYKWIMWLPWSLIVIFALFSAEYFQNQKFFFISGSIAFVLTFIILFWEINHHHSLSFIDNKYPPTLFLISFGILSICIIFFLFQRFTLAKPLQHCLNFLSWYSYTIYFIHYTILTLCTDFIGTKHFTWLTLFLSVFLPTILIQGVINRLNIQSK